MRGCLKHPSPSPSPSPSPTSSNSIATPPPTRGPTPPLIPPDAPSLAAKRGSASSFTDACLTRRCVHFCSGLVDKVFVADEWDRSPADVTPRLTYQDVLELKEIQRSLPHAAQPLDDPDLPRLDSRGVPRTHFLNTVPVGLVPLIAPTASPISQPKLATSPPSVISKSKAESSASDSSSCSPSHPPLSPPSTPPPQILVASPSPSSSHFPSPPPASEPWVPPPPPPRLPYNIPIQPRPFPRFNFLPLLETPISPAASTLPSPDLPPPPLSTSPGGIPRVSPPRNRSPPARQSSSAPFSSSPPQSSQTVKPVPSSSSSTLIGVSSATAGTSLGLASPDRPSKPLSGQVFSPSPFSSVPLPNNSKSSPWDDPTHLEAELSRIWHRHPCNNTDGDTEAEESETESSVVHTEAESDGESTPAVFSSSGIPKVVPTPVTAATDADAGDGDDVEGDMSLVELENGVMAFVRTPRRR